MSRRLPSLALIAALAAGLALPGRAGDFDKQIVPSDATWVAHANLVKLRESTVGRFLLNRLSGEEANRQFAAFKAIFQFDPRQDLSAITVFGTAAGEENSVALLRGRFNTAQLITLVQANPQFKSVAHGNDQILSWVDEKNTACGKRTYGCVAAADLLILGQKAETVAHALDVIDGATPNAQANTTLPGLERATSATFFLASADMARMPALDPNAALLKQNKSVLLTLGEQGADMQGLLLMVAPDAETAKTVRAAAQGIAALVTLQGPQNPLGARLASAIQFGGEGDQVEIKMSCPAAEIATLLEAEALKKEQAAKAAAAAVPAAP